MNVALLRSLRGPVSVVLAVVLTATHLTAQTSSGTIAGVVRDATGATVAGATITVTSEQTGFVRTVLSAEDGRYAAALLPPGGYLVTARSPALASSSYAVVVMAGMTKPLDLVVGPLPVAEVAHVSAASTRLRDNQHTVGGWIDRDQIARQPLNGRNVLELAKLEPGVPSPSRLSGGRVFIAPLGAGLNPVPRVGFTRVTVDGGHIETPGTVASLLQVSPDAVEEVHVATANFEIATGLATSGAVNVVTRSGGNRYRGSAFSLYRDREWSASPSVFPGSVSADSPFRRHQAGATLGGPLRPNRAFFFVAYERHDQRDAVVVQPADALLRQIGGSFVSPYSGTLVTGRVDVRISDRQRAFVRHTHDANDSVAPADGIPILPSGWANRPVRAHQTLAALSTTIGAHGVNELRSSYYLTRTSISPAGTEGCSLPCVGGGGPRIVLSDGGPGVLALGTSFSSASAGDRFQLSDVLVWQRRSHLLQFGFDLERVSHSVFSTDSDPVTLTLWTPGAVQARDASIALPASLFTVDDLLELPLQSFTASVGSGGVLQRGFQPIRRFHSFRAHAADRWTLGSRLTVNAGLGWSFEPGVLNDDLQKPEWLGPLTGARGLSAPHATPNFAGTVGLAWRATADGRTILRAAAGRYVEALSRTVALNLANERVLLSPLGTGKLTVTGAGLGLSFSQPTTFTGADLLAMLPSIRGSVAASLNPANRDFSVVNLDATKEGRNLYDPDYVAPRAVHLSLGVDREISSHVVAGLDAVWKRFTHTFINGIDYNRFFAAGDSVIPRCVGAQRTDLNAVCTNGSLFFDTTSGRARYAGLLARLDARFPGQTRIHVSYALGSFVGTNGTGTGTTETSDGRVFGFNNDDWSENVGPLPTDVRHMLNVSGTVTAPAHIDIALNVSAYSRAPFSAYVAGMDFNGDGTTNDLLPGTRVNQFNRGLTSRDLVGLVDAYNTQYAGVLTAGGKRAPTLSLPDTFAFNDNFFTLDMRVARSMRAGSGRLTVFADVFNVLNTMNLVGFSGNLAVPAAFGQPTARVGQAFGSGGPRAAQFGIRVDY